MNVIFLSSLYTKRVLSEIEKNTKGNVNYAGNALQWQLVKGLSHHLGSIKVINAPFIGSYPFFYKNPFIRDDQLVVQNKINVTSVRYCNLSLVKNKFIRSALTEQIECYLRANASLDSVIVVYGMVGSYIKAAIEIKRRYPSIKICLIITDFPEYCNNSDGLIMAFRHALRENLYKYIDSMDAFVLLADAMAEALRLQKKPWTRVEGMVDPDEHDYAGINPDIPKKIILYAGTLASRYGIVDMLDAFREIDNDDYELLICGAGNAEEVIKHRAKSDQRIRFLGLVSRDRALKLQQSATVLLNPRSSEGEYTRYSFPSKTMEYLLSGKPVIMRKLPGMPEEYHRHLFLTDDDSVESLKKRIVEVCEMSADRRAHVGGAARDFVLKDKNYLVQTEKIVRLLMALNGGFKVAASVCSSAHR